MRGRVTRREHYPTVRPYGDDAGATAPRAEAGGRRRRPRGPGAVAAFAVLMLVAEFQRTLPTPHLLALGG